MIGRVASTLALCILGLGVVGLAAAAPEGTLINAAESKQHDAALKLLAGGADAKAKDVDGTTALHWAAHYADAEFADKLIRAGADVNARNDYDSTPMMEAATVGSAEVLKLLVKAGADVESTSREGQTALMAVARTGNVEAAEVLLKKGAKVNAVEQWGGQSPLMWAAAQSQPAMVQVLIKHGASVDARGTVRDWQRRVTAEGRPKNMNHGGFTPLLYAAREGCIECGRFLLKAKADINLQDPDGLTPLVLALTNMRFDFAAMLIEAGADVNKWDFYGRTPLYSAVDLNTLPRGGRPDLPSMDKLSGYDIEEMLLKKGANPNIQLKLRPPYRNGVYDRGGDQVISTGATPLLVAAKAGDAKSVALLLKYKAIVDLPNTNGVTPFMVAAGVGQGSNPTRGRYKTDDEAVECVKLLKDAGADVNAKNDQGLTSLHAAASLGWDNTIRTLVADGAQLEALDNKGLTPIDYAVGRQERGFLEPEHTRKDSSVTILKDYIVAATGRAPKEFAGTLNKQTRGTGGAPDRANAGGGQ
ncbi:MAG: ankyrin repeat domain-containing protein [Gammaproteobacteria bacterium]